MRIAVSAMGSTNDEMVSSMNRIAEAKADIMELRLDTLAESPNLEKLLSTCKGTPKIVTHRSRDEGGKNPYVTEDERLDIFRKAINLGAKYVDIEFASGLYKKIKGGVSTELIVSTHNSDETPENISDLYQSIRKTNANIVKIATHAKTRTDSLRMLSLISDVYERADKPIIGICMGPNGVITREWGPVYGAYLTFASIDDTTSSAPGQISIDKLRENWRNLKLDSTR